MHKLYKYLFERFFVMEMTFLVGDGTLPLAGVRKFIFSIVPMKWKKRQDRFYIIGSTRFALLWEEGR